MHLSHIPQCIIQNRKVHISVLNGALWDMRQVHCEIDEIGLLAVITAFVIRWPICRLWSLICSGPSESNNAFWTHGISRNSHFFMRLLTVSCTSLTAGNLPAVRAVQGDYETVLPQYPLTWNAQSSTCHQQLFSPVVFS